MTEAPVITVDGPGGTGKGTLCGRLSRWLGWHLLDSGALYRILALLARREGVALSDGPGVAALARDELEVRFLARDGDDPVRVTLNGVDIDARIRGEDCGNAASSLAKHGLVRAAILEWQRDFRRPPGLIADGRDMGTAVFPQAELKIFLTARPEERAKRRHKQLKEKGIAVKLEDIAAEIAERDNRDRRRAVSPLKPAVAAVVIDTSASGADEVFQQVATLVQQRFEKKRGSEG